MREEFDFNDIRPYYDNEINPALQRIVAVPEFTKILDFLFPGKDNEQIIRSLLNVHTAIDFQKVFMYPLVYSIVEKTSDGLTTSGFDSLPSHTPCLFVANHRDIVLDSAILQVVLLDHGHDTSEITFGSNLMINQFIIDLGKVNRMFKVYRGGNRMELFRNSKLLSAYIRHTITEKHTSAWIAQRSGRTKDGFDKTETGLLKMFHISGGCEFKESFTALNIVPLSISYEFEPCIGGKVREMASIARGIPYKKEADEDFRSILDGITRQKGRIHLAACSNVNEYLDDINDAFSQNDKINKLAEMMDASVYSNFKLWPNNYIAFDMLRNGHDFDKMYTPLQYEAFKKYMEKELSLFQGSHDLEKEIFLKIYANPLINASAVKK